MSQPLRLQIPATSANLGLGFDSMGIALTKYLTLEATLSDDSRWYFDYQSEALHKLAPDERNLVAKTAIALAESYGVKMPALRVKMDSEIPLTHGLGSSSSAIIAGIELANHFLNLTLSLEDKLRYASQLEGHPDNVGPCLTGGVFVGYYHDGELAYHQFNLDGLGLIISVPSYELSTKLARQAIPDHYDKESAVLQNARNNVLVLSMLKGDYQTMGQLMMQDAFHEPYRQPLIKEFVEIKEKALAEGAYATVISGAGPSVLTLCPLDMVESLLHTLSTIEGSEHEQVFVHYH